MITKGPIEKLIAYNGGNYPVTSLYLKLGPSERVNFKFKTTLKNLLKKLKQELGERTFTEAALESVERDLAKITNLVDDTSKISDCRGICILSSAKNKFWKVFKLPNIYRNQLIVDQSPLLGQLIKIFHDYGNIVTVLVDRKKARIFRQELNGTREILDYFDPYASRTKKFKSTQGKFKQRVISRKGSGNLTQGYGEHTFHRNIENETHQHYKYVSDMLFDYYNEKKFDFLVLGGTEKNIIEFTHHLHSYLQNKVVGTIKADVNKSTTWQVAELGLEVVQDYKAKEQKKILKELESKLELRYAVNGINPTIKALARGQVKTLIVQEGFSCPGFICPETRILSAGKKKIACPEGLEPMRVADVVSYVIEDISRQKSEIEILPDSLARRKIDGIGAILRFK